MRVILIILIAFSRQTAIAQIIHWGIERPIIQIASRNSRVINTELYYPANTNGDGVPIAEWH
jgi:hypothetical protein